MKIKTEELVDEALDWSVAVVSGESSPQRGIGGGCVVAHGHTLHRYMPSVWWEHGGPIIERERITVSTHDKSGDEAWRAMHMRTMLTGPTPLVAAMRCLVASNLGAEVEVPDELAPQAAAQQPEGGA